jgi:hypothetical protein
MSSKRVKEFLEEYIIESSPSWIKNKSTEELEGYEKEHPNAGKITIDYIKRELFNRKRTLPSWLTGKQKEVTHYVDKEGKKHDKNYVSKEEGKETEYVEKDGKKIEVFPVHTEFKGKREFSHYADEQGSKFNKEEVKKEQMDKFTSGYGDNKKEVKPVLKDIYNLGKEIRDSLIKAVGSEMLNKGVEVVEKNKLTKKPYSDGTVVVLDEKDKWMGTFEGANVHTNKGYNTGRRSYHHYKRNELINEGKKFIYIPSKQLYPNLNAMEGKIRHERLDVANKGKEDELKGKIKERRSYDDTTIKDYYNKKLAEFRHSKHGEDLTEKIIDLRENIKEEVKKEIETNMKKMLEKIDKKEDINIGSLINDSLMKRFNNINELEKINNKIQKKEHLYDWDVEKYNIMVKQLKL